MKIALLTIGAVLVLLALGWGIRYYTLEQEKFFAPKEENVRRVVFENTNSYNRGKVQELNKYRLEYMGEKDPKMKGAILTTIRFGFADFPPDRIQNSQLRNFFETIMNGGEPE